MRELGILLLVTILFFFPVLGYSQAPPVEEGVSISATIEGEAPPSPPGGGAIYIPPTKVVFEGRAYPAAILTLLKNDRVTATFSAESSGLFKKELSGVPEGTYTFGIWAEDTEGRRSVTQSFTIDLVRGTTTTISGIFVPPTIELGLARVGWGDKVNILGQVFPESQVNIFISPREIVKETIASLEGKWLYQLDTSPLNEGEYKVRAKAFFGDGEQSPFSQTLSLSVSVKCKGADLNFDDKINIIDFSILLYFWQSTSPENVCVDINQDGIVDLTDFSIMMYQWTG